MAMKNADERDSYRYDHVTAQLFKEDMRFREGSLAPGQSLGAHKVLTLEGERVGAAELIADKPMLLVMGSVSCPMTDASMPLVKALHGQFGNRVDFIMLNVREAHPGENIPQPKQTEEKLRHAKALRERYAIPFQVVSDDIDGRLHKALDSKPNAAFLFDRQGKLVFRALWVGDEKGVRQALEAASRGERPKERESERKLMPMAQGIGSMRDVLERSGDRAVSDIWRAAPPMAALAWLASLFKPLSPAGRGLAAMTVVGLVVLFVLALPLIWLL